MTVPNGKLYCNSIEQYFTINKDMKYLGEKGKSFTTCVINKQIIKMLPPRIRMEYIMNSGKTKDDKEDILEAMDSLDTFVKLTKMVKTSKKANSKNGGNKNKNTKKKSNRKSNSKANQGSRNQKKASTNAKRLTKRN